MGYIYQIVNKLNKATYIGSILRRKPEHRWHRHITDLKAGKHHSKHLQRAWNKYGEQAFTFEVLQQIPDTDDVIKLEQQYLDNRKMNYPSNLNYNVCWVAGSCVGRRWSKKARQALSKAHKGIKMSESAKLKQLQTWENKCLVPYSFTAPDGIVYKDIRNLRKFCREHKDLNVTALRLLHNGKLNVYNGWTKTGIKRVIYKLESKTGETHQGYELKFLCTKVGLNYKGLHRACISRGKPYKGWKVTKL